MVSNGRSTGDADAKETARRVSTEVERFWKAASRVAEHLYEKDKAAKRRERNLKKLDALVEKSELFAASVGDALDSSSLVEQPYATPPSYDSPHPPLIDSTASQSLTQEERELAQQGLCRMLVRQWKKGVPIAAAAAALENYSYWQRARSEDVVAIVPARSAGEHLGLKTPVPSLLRNCTLREYQHVGLDWLVTLHNQGLNGILADEMGLGKTIQTVAMLAHLACAENIWGPHLVVVPTSVVLNWELEFKRWLPGFKVLTYYGSQKERKWKRIGWSKPNSFNVCIVSYNLILRDAQAFRRMRWYYLILDEAQHIKNFRSQRWQTLLTFNSQRRLLLTGTPLQNNLIEMWSLLHFLMPDVFASHSQFREWFADPLTDAIEKQNSAEGQRELLLRLHKVIRPFILRRLKRQVEKQMPKKYEHIVKVELSRRQQGLYEEFMNQRDIRHEIENLDCMGMMNILMQLRKVCNHPDLFEPRPVRSPLAMLPLSLELPATLLLWSTTPYNRDYCHYTNYASHCLPLSEMRGDTRRRAVWSAMLALEKTELGEYLGRGEQPQYRCFLDYAKDKLGRCPIGQTKRWLQDIYLSEDRERLLILRNYEKHQRAYMNVLYGEEAAPLNTPLYGRDCVRLCFIQPTDWREGNSTRTMRALCLRPFERLEKYASTWAAYFQYVEKAVAPPAKVYFVGGDKQSARISRMERNLSPNLAAMSRMLDIIEAFMNLHGFTYVRLDGSTPVEQRQLVVEAFNKSLKIFAFIASTRAGGVGINLTGADCVIFYDSDWNPAMDRQAMDRCHRIGQTRDVHIFRLLSHHTIEENIFHKQLQKRMLDDVVVDQGAFTTQTIAKWTGVDVADMLKGMDDDGSTSTADLLKMTSNDIEEAMEGAEDEDDVEARDSLLQEQRQEGIDLQRDFEGPSAKELGSSKTPTAPVSPEASSVNGGVGDELSSIVRYAIRCVTEQLQNEDESDSVSTSETGSVWASQATSETEEDSGKETELSDE
ncbi:swr1 complex component [Perkinsus olseni]|uniref:Swr1 complex component n=1 Tax=Perkinsus olseni TaxID=32597 RepID=A0A7J6MX98_PEROL|nr:swr1 complex component [Perkinsus olseni]